MSWPIGVESIDHMGRQQLYRDGGITASSPVAEGGIDRPFWPIGKQTYQADVSDTHYVILPAGSDPRS